MTKHKRADDALPEDRVKVAAYQAPLLAEGSRDALSLIRERVRECETIGVSILCCPEAILGGLADNSRHPARFTIRTDEGQLTSILAPLASDTVTLIVGFSEVASDGNIYNAAAVLRSGEVVGVYRKIHPAIHQSVYAAGSQIPVFQADGLTFGVVICNDSNFPELARHIAAQGASVLFIPTNNGLPRKRACAKLSTAACDADIALAVENRLWVVRADVAGENGLLASYGCSEIVNVQGTVVQRARQWSVEMLIAEI